MAGELLSNYYAKYFTQKQPVAQVIQEQIIEEAVFESPFLTAESVFEEISHTLESDRFYSLSLIGPQGKGKTFLASVFGTVVEKNDFLVIYGKAEDILIDLHAWIDKVADKIKKHGNYKINFILDDMSYSTGELNQKKASAFKHFVADIRHVFEKALGLEHNTLEIFMTYISHRLHSLPPMLRTSGSFIFAAMQSADRDDAMKLIPKNKEMRDKLDGFYKFIQTVSIDGPKFGKLELNFGSNKLDFIWGNQSTPGDGRLMVSYHAGEIKLFNSKIVEGLINIDSDEYRIKYTPPPPPSQEEIDRIKQKKQESFEKKAREMFSSNEAKDDTEESNNSLSDDQTP